MKFNSLNMNQSTIVKLEDYRKKLKTLMNFESALRDNDKDRLELGSYSTLSHDWIGPALYLSTEPEIKKCLLCVVRARIKYYNDKIKEL